MRRRRRRRRKGLIILSHPTDLNLFLL